MRLLLNIGLNVTWRCFLKIHSLSWVQWTSVWASSMKPVLSCLWIRPCLQARMCVFDASARWHHKLLFSCHLIWKCSCVCVCVCVCVFVCERSTDTPVNHGGNRWMRNVYSKHLPCSVFNIFFSMWWNVYHWDYNMLNELNVTLSFISVHNWALVALRTSAEAFYASCVCLRFNGSVVVIISVSFQRFIQWQAGVIHQDFCFALFLALKSEYLCAELGCF